MNDIFEMAKQYIDKAAQTVSNKSNEIVEKTKCKSAIASTEEQVTKAYAEIGRYYYESHLSGELFEGFVADKCASIDELKQKLEELKLRLAQLNDQKLCPKCGEKCVESAVYCSKCGYHFYDDSTN